MSEPPEPLTSIDHDLRGMRYMPVEIMRLFDSDFYILSTGDEFKAGLSLWCKAFFQVPAGSLPSDERLLAHLSGAGAKWETVREMALRGWIRCRDGRLYHPVVCEKAREAFKQRESFKKRTENATKARMLGPERDGHRDDERDGQRDGNVTSRSNPTKGGGSGGVSEDSSGAKAPPAQSAARSPRLFEIEKPPKDAKDALWRQGVPIVERLTGRPERAARSLLGKLLGKLGDDAAATMQLLVDAEEQRPIEPTEWLMAAAQDRRRRRSRIAKMSDTLGEPVPIPP